MTKPRVRNVDKVLDELELSLLAEMGLTPQQVSETMQAVEDDIDGTFEKATTEEGEYIPSDAIESDGEDLLVDGEDQEAEDEVSTDDEPTEEEAEEEEVEPEPEEEEEDEPTDDEPTEEEAEIEDLDTPTEEEEEEPEVEDLDETEPRPW